MRRPLLALAVALVAPVAPAVRAAEPPDPAKLAAVIDARLAAGWKRAGATPAPAADDATFLRRASLDLIGRVPTVAEARAFLADAAANKRERLVARLCGSGAHTRHMATFWRRTWLPQADAPEFARLADDFETWVAARLRANARYDRVVRELLTTHSGPRPRGTESPVGFFTASENKPDALAANATRAFLGVNLDCAQCHDHPFARWTRDQFWQTAAFFAPPAKGADGRAVPPELTIPNTNKALKAELLDGGAVAWPAALAPDTGRKLLADWLTAKKNPYFAKNAVNRLWAQVYGTALVEPLDDLSGDSGTTGYHAELLAELADAFAASDFDLNYLTRALVLTRAYQLSATAGPATYPRLFARMPVRGLTGEQLYDSIRTAAGLPPERADTGRGLGLEARNRFAAQFYVERPVLAERSTAQALSLMNGPFTNDLADPAKNPTLAGVIGAPFLDSRGKVEALFLAVLGRAPTGGELALASKHVDGSAPAARARALGDLFWALVNGTEFNTNH